MPLSPTQKHALLDLDLKVLDALEKNLRGLSVVDVCWKLTAYLDKHFVLTTDGRKARNAVHRSLLRLKAKGRVKWEALGKVWRVT